MTIFRVKKLNQIEIFSLIHHHYGYYLRLILKNNPKNRVFTSQIQRTAIIESKVHLKDEIDHILNYLRYQKIDANDSEDYQKTYCRLDEVTKFYRWIENSYGFYSFNTPFKSG